MDFFRRQNWDIVGRSRLWLGISAVVITFGMIWWAAFGLNLGVDFTGGVLLRYQTDLPISGGRAEEARLLAEVRSMLNEHNLAKSQLQLSGDNHIYIRVPAQEDAAGAQSAAEIEREIHAGLEELFGTTYGGIHMIGSEAVGPIVGRQLRQQALYALILGCLLILIYITIRYEFRFAVAAIFALLHDVAILITGVALLRIELDTSFVAALLTVIGYSINDTVVIFDRIRENRKLRRGAPFEATVNASLLETMARSINTAVTTLFALIALAGWGGTTIRGFAIALIIGIASGAYSSILTAGPILAIWERRAIRKREASRPGRSGESRRAVRRRAETEQAADIEDVDSDDEAAGDDEAAARKLSARETIRQAEAREREEQRLERRARRKKKSGSGGKRRY